MNEVNCTIKENVKKVTRCNMLLLLRLVILLFFICNVIRH